MSAVVVFKNWQVLGGKEGVGEGEERRRGMGEGEGEEMMMRASRDNSSKLLMGLLRCI